MIKSYTDYEKVLNHKKKDQDCGFNQRSVFYPWNKLTFCWLCYQKHFIDLYSPPCSPVSSPRRDTLYHNNNYTFNHKNNNN